MRRLIVDNVNNLSGAPVAVEPVSRLLGAPIVCIREEPAGPYRSATCGIRSVRPALYPLGVLFLLLKRGFWRHLRAADTVVLNTALVFPFLLVARISGKTAVAVLHEYSAKNLLYRIAIRTTVLAAHLIVTPSREAYYPLLGRLPKWRVIPNALPVEYFSQPVKRNWNPATEVRVLFVGDGRAYKGRELFRSVSRRLSADTECRWIFHEIGDAAYQVAHGASRKLGPHVYDGYDFLLVLTDNRIWRETFGVVGCEAASRGCIPLFTDAFAYRELWAPFDAELFLPDRTVEAIVRRLRSLVANKEQLAELRLKLVDRAALVSGPEAMRDGWRKLLLEVERH